MERFRLFPKYDSSRMAGLALPALTSESGLIKCLLQLPLNPDISFRIPKLILGAGHLDMERCLEAFLALDCHAPDAGVYLRSHPGERREGNGIAPVFGMGWPKTPHPIA